MNVNKICILGGGSSGFITSSILAKYREQSGLDFDIKVIYSKSIGNVGVGESSIQNIIELFQYLELEDIDWMKLCHATYKTSIRFENFYKDLDNHLSFQIIFLPLPSFLILLNL